MKYPLVHIVWDDAAVLAEGWQEDDYVPKEQLVDTVGFLIKETENHVVVASCVSSEQHNGHFQIPRPMIKKTRYLKVKL